MGQNHANFPLDGIERSVPWTSIDSQTGWGQETDQISLKFSLFICFLTNKVFIFYFKVLT